ncbi:MAG: alpha-rhamnosidase, partial [Sphingobacteriales bacterium]|nr:alpha-rhamnosidase [Sphingobacteriales bacterium]
SPFRITIPTYYVAGPGERVDMKQHIKDWKKLSYSADHWQAAKTIVPGYPKNKIGATGEPNGWMLMPSPLPQMELKQQRLLQLRKAEGVIVPASFPANQSVITIKANTTATLLLDQTFLTNAYPTIIFSGGKNSSVMLGYQEALFTKFPEKGNRNETDGKIFIGRKDSIFSDGSDHQEFTTLSWRTYRYLQINITTKDMPLTLEDVYGTFIGYPFVLNARLETDNAEVQKMLEIGWRTARSCAIETYMDCPYYEQLQYIGDTRIQALVSLYNSGDDHLVKNAINQIYYSQQPEGLTQSRYPTTTPQYIPPFSLWYIGMLHDYMMYGKDTAFVKNKLTSMRQVLNYFKTFQQPDGSLKNLPWWNFTDWVEAKNWNTGERSPGKDGNAAVLDLQLLWAYELAADMEQKLGNKENAAIYNKDVVQLKKTIQNKYWDSGKMLYADRSEKDLYSQHTNALAILTGVVNGKSAAMIGKQLLTDTTLAQSSIYFKYYLHLALVKAGYGNDYLGWLDKWRENIVMGLTTWAEISEVSSARSDCHAWGASPNIEFFRIILGIDSDAPGFSNVKIEPHLGSIMKIGGEMPHPNGKISVKYVNENGHLKADIILPEKTKGQFNWKGKSYLLKPGKNSITL